MHVEKLFGLGQSWTNWVFVCEVTNVVLNTILKIFLINIYGRLCMQEV